MFAIDIGIGAYDTNTIVNQARNSRWTNVTSDNANIVFREHKNVKRLESYINKSRKLLKLFMMPKATKQVIRMIEFLFQFYKALIPDLSEE